MSLRVPCKHCGRDISLRKMPNGQYVPFDKWTKNLHRCQESKVRAVSESAGLQAESSVKLDSTASVGDLILQIIEGSPGIKAKRIASLIVRKYGIKVDKSEVNRWLYRDLKNKVHQSSPHHWSTGSSDGSKYQDAMQNQAKHEIPEHRPVLAVDIQNSTQTGTNRLLWIVIALLVVVVLILLKKYF